MREGRAHSCPAPQLLRPAGQAFQSLAAVEPSGCFSCPLWLAGQIIPLAPLNRRGGVAPDCGAMAVAFSSANAASFAETPASARGTPQRLRRLRAAAASKL